jgi:hypothetical protein
VRRQRRGGEEVAWGAEGGSILGGGSVMTRPAVEPATHLGQLPGGREMPVS